MFVRRSFAAEVDSLIPKLRTSCSRWACGAHCLAGHSTRVFQRRLPWWNKVARPRSTYYPSGLVSNLQLRQEFRWWKAVAPQTQIRRAEIGCLSTSFLALQRPYQGIGHKIV